MRAIVDTNVLVSGFLSSSGAPAQIVNAILEGALIAVMSETTFAELELVLARSRLKAYFKRADFTPAQFLENLRQVAEFVEPRRKVSSIRDAKDRPFLDLAANRPRPDFL